MGKDGTLGLSCVSCCLPNTVLIDLRAQYRADLAAMSDDMVAPGVARFGREVVSA